MHVWRQCYRNSMRIRFLIRKFFYRLNMRFNQQLTESKRFLNIKKWIVEKSNKWIQLKPFSFNNHRFKIKGLIDWLIELEKLNSNGLIDGLVVEGQYSR